MTDEVVSQSAPGPESAPHPESPWAARPTIAARNAFVVSLLLTPVVVGLAALLGGADAARGALLGCALPLLVVAGTWASAVIGRRRPPQAFALVLVASYAVKLVVIAVGLRLFRDVEGIDKVVFGVVAGLGLLLGVVVEALVVARTRAPYVEP